MNAVWLLLALLVVLAGGLVRLRVRRRTRDRGPEVTDETVREIEREGTVETDEEEPLDWDRIREEEDRFWAETWDRPEPYWE